MEWEETLRNPGHAVVNAPAVPRAAKTVLVVGVARSGTTSVARVLHELGVPMGRVTPDVYEDLDMAKALEEGRGVRRLARQRDAEHAVWGFKRPEHFQVIRRADRLFRNPHAVVVFRDPLATGRREEISMEQPLLPHVVRAARRTLELAETVAASPIPMLLVSYEKAMADPSALVGHVVDFVGLSPTDEQRERAVRSVESGPTVYLRRSTVREPPD